MKAYGFAPVADASSRLLILGSFPSVKSRAVSFYYGNPRNRFWATLCAFFKEEVPPDIAGKCAFVLERKIALWDIVTACEIEGSSDASVKEAQIADIPSLLSKTQIGKIFCNGVLSYKLLIEHFPALSPIAVRLPSTSPANPRFSLEAWQNALEAVFVGNFA